MKDVATATTDTRRGGERLYVANCTVLVTVNPVQLRMVFRALLVQAWQASLLSPEPKARMPASQCLIACIPRQILTFFAVTDVCKCPRCRKGCVLLRYGLVTVSALPVLSVGYLRRERSLYSLQVIPRWYGVAWQVLHCSVLQDAVGQMNRLVA